MDNLNAQYSRTEGDINKVLPFFISVLVPCTPRKRANFLFNPVPVRVFGHKNSDQTHLMVSRCRHHRK